MPAWFEGIPFGIAVAALFLISCCWRRPCTGSAVA